MSYAPWEAATRCTDGAQPGAKALMAAILATDDGLKNWGIFNCRNTALGNRSAHGEGRALDIGCTVAVGARLVKLLRKVGPEKLGISVIIHDRKIYSRRHPDGAPYNGVPHRDHVHVETTRKAAATLSLATARRILAGEPKAAWVVYTVKSGDTLGEIATRFHTTAVALADVNDLRNPDVIAVGQRLRVPA